MKQLDILILHGMGRKSSWFSGVADVELLFARNDRKNNYLVHNCYLPVPNSIKEYKFDAIFMMSTFIDFIAQYGLESRWINQYDFLKKDSFIKIAFPQDDYWCSEIKDSFYVNYKINKVYPVCPENCWRELIPQYLGSRNSVELGYTTYVTERMVNLCNLEINWTERKFDFVYRAKKIPNAPNKYGYIKGVIGDRFLRAMVDYPGFRCDISTNPNELIRGDDWYRFLANSRATLGSNSGSSILLRNNEVKKRLATFLRLNPKAEGFEVERSVFRESDRNKSYTAISPRNVEAAMLGVLQVLTPGDYGGVLKPNEDYLLLDEDCDNIDEVIRLFSDQELCLNLVRNCRKKIISNDSIRAHKFIEKNILFVRDNQICRYGRECRGDFVELKFQYAKYEKIMYFFVDAYVQCKQKIVKTMPKRIIDIIKNNMRFH